MVKVLLCAAVVAGGAAMPADSLQAAAPAPCAAAPARPAFDVVSIRPADANGSFGFSHTSDGLSIISPLRQIIQYAYNLRDFQLNGGPDWLANAAWRIDAKSDAPDQGLWDKRMQELQSVLIDRFHFTCHMETKEMPVYDLVLAKGGSKLKASTAEKKHDSTSLSGHAGTFHAAGTGVGAQRIAELLASSLDRLVVDKTGLTGTYDFTLDWASDIGGQPTSEASSGPTMFTAVEEQLGLRLQPAKAPVPVMVIDHLEKPTEN